MLKQNALNRASGFRQMHSESRHISKHTDMTDSLKHLLTKVFSHWGSCWGDSKMVLDSAFFGWACRWLRPYFLPGAAALTVWGMHHALKLTETYSSETRDSYSCPYMLPFLLRKKKGAAVYPVRIPTAIPQSAPMCKCCLCCVLPGPLSCTRPKQHRECALPLGYELIWRGHHWIPSPVFLWNSLEYLCILCPVLLQLVPGENEPFCARRRLSTDAKPLEGTSSAGLCSDCTERAAQLKGPSQRGRSASVSQAKPNMRSKDAEWRSEFSDVLTTAVLLPNRTVIHAANLLSHRQIQASAQTLTENFWGEWGKTLWVQHAYEQTHGHAWVCDAEKTATLTSGYFIPDSFSWNPPPLIFFFGCIKPGILKACFLVWWFLLVFFLLSFFKLSAILNLF